MAIVKKDKPDTATVLAAAKELIEKNRQLSRDGYTIQALVVHAQWMGQKILFRSLVDAYKVQRTPLFLFPENFGALNKRNNILSDIFFMMQKQKFYEKFGEHLDDIEYIEEYCLWDDSAVLINDWNRDPRLPDGKMSPIEFAFYTFDDARFYGVVDPEVGVIFSNELKALPATHPKVLAIEQVLVEKAFLNSILIMDENNVKESVAVIDSHWLEHYREEASLRNIDLKVSNCTGLSEVSI